MLSWEKPLVKPMASGSIFHHIIFQSTSYIYDCLFCNLYFPIYTTKIPKIFILLSLSDPTFASGREGIDDPFIALVARFLIVCACTRDLRVVSYWIDTLVLKNWGKYLRYSAASPFPLQGKPTQAQDVARRISDAVAGRSSLKLRHTKYPSQTHLPRIYIICHLPLVFLSPTSPLPFYLPSLSQSSPLFFACLSQSPFPLQGKPTQVLYKIKLWDKANNRLFFLAIDLRFVVQVASSNLVFQIC